MSRLPSQLTSPILTSHPLYVTVFTLATVYRRFHFRLQTMKRRTNPQCGTQDTTASTMKIVMHHRQMTLSQLEGKESIAPVVPQLEFDTASASLEQDNSDTSQEDVLPQRSAEVQSIHQSQNTMVNSNLSNIRPTRSRADVGSLRSEASSIDDSKQYTPIWERDRTLHVSNPDRIPPIPESSMEHPEEEIGRGPDFFGDGISIINEHEFAEAIQESELYGRDNRQSENNVFAAQRAESPSFIHSNSQLDSPVTAVLHSKRTCQKSNTFRWFHGCVDKKPAEDQDAEQCEPLQRRPSRHWLLPLCHGCVWVGVVSAFFVVTSKVEDKRIRFDCYDLKYQLSLHKNKSANAFASRDPSGEIVFRSAGAGHVITPSEVVLPTSINPHGNTCLLFPENRNLYLSKSLPLLFFLALTANYTAFALKALWSKLFAAEMRKSGEQGTKTLLLKFSGEILAGGIGSIVIVGAAWGVMWRDRLLPVG